VAARKGHPRVRGAIDEAGWREIGHIFAHSLSETAADETEKGVHVARLAAVPHWLTVLVLVASTDGIATVPRKLAERHAEMLGLQVIDPPFEPDLITVSTLRRSGVEDAGVDWFLQQIREAIGL
jgi:DNA-binding transcriptional LysR family regulator